MKFLVERTSQWDDAKRPIKEATQEELTYLDYRTVKTLKEARPQFWYQKWYDAGENHREENGMIVCDRKVKEKKWVVEIGSLDDLLELYKNNGTMVIKRREYKEIDLGIEIYDGYRE